MMICPHCQSENREGAKFCNECGSPLLSCADKTQVIDAVALGDAQELDGREEADDADKTQVINADTPLNAEDPKVSGADETNSSKLIDEDDSDFIDDAAELQDIEEAEDEELGQTPDEQAASHDAIDDAEREALDEALPRIDIAQSGGSDSLASEQTRKIDLNAANTVDLSGFERLSTRAMSRCALVALRRYDGASQNRGRARACPEEIRVARRREGSEETQGCP